MYKVIESYGSLYLTDESSGEILHELIKPAISFSYNDGSICARKIGNYDKVKADFDAIHEKLEKAGLMDMAYEYLIMDLPKDIELLNKVYNNPQHLKRYLTEFNIILP